MKIIILPLILLATTLCALQAEDQIASLPTCIDEGFKAYLTKGKEEAVKVWSDHSTPGGKTLKNSLLAGMSKVDEGMGRMLRAELIGEVSISPSCKQIYIVWCLEKGSLFVEFQCYKPKDEWQIEWMRFGPDKSFLPAGALSAKFK